MTTSDWTATTSTHSTQQLLPSHGSRLAPAQRARRSLTHALCAAAIVCVSVLASACSESPAQALERAAEASRADGGERAMDGVEKRAAAKTAGDSAREALQKRDLRTLRMVLTYVLYRAPEPLLPPEEVSLLEVGIQCLERGRGAEKSARIALADVADSKLARATRLACLGPLR